MLPVLTSLIALQALDTAAEAARRRLAEHPAALQALERKLADANAAVEAATTALAANQHTRRELEKHVAGIDTRLARFDEHKAAIKTNHEYTALLHEISTAKTEKDGVEEQILVLMEEGDQLQTAVKRVEQEMAGVKREGEAARAAMTAERSALEAEIARLMAEKAGQSAHADKAMLAKYEQLLKARKMVAVAEMRGEICTACHVRLRPAVTQQVRRNSEIVTCDSCQRILYYIAPPSAAPTAEASSSPA